MIDTILIRFCLTFLLALIYGIERQKSSKPIGFGTFIFVSVGSCGLAIIAIIVSAENPLPLLGATITGIGFLGAGALIRTSDKVFGFSNAASIWIFSIIGLVIGVGEYVIGILMYILIWVVIFVDRLMEKKGMGSHQKKLIITSSKDMRTEELRDILGTKYFKILVVDINRKNNTYMITLSVEGSKTTINQLPKRLFKAGWVDSFRIE